MTNSYKCINKWYTTTTNTTTIDSWTEQVATRTLRIRLLCSSIFGKSTCRKNPRKRYSLRFRRKMSPLLHSFLYLALSSFFFFFYFLLSKYIYFFLFIYIIYLEYLFLSIWGSVCFVQAYSGRKKGGNCVTNGVKCPKIVKKNLIKLIYKVYCKSKKSWPIYETYSMIEIYIQYIHLQMFFFFNCNNMYYRVQNGRMWRKRCRSPLSMKVCTTKLLVSKK